MGDKGNGATAEGRALEKAGLPSSVIVIMELGGRDSVASLSSTLGGAVASSETVCVCVFQDMKGPRC